MPLHRFCRLAELAMQSQHGRFLICLTSCKIMAETARPDVRSVRFRGMSVKILVAEDDPQSSEFLRKGLVQEGHSVECVGDGRDALSYCLYNECEMLILDRMMPGMD